MSQNKYIRRAKIICTLGPSSETYEQILALAKAGMDVARLNFSHGTHDDHKEKIAIVRKISRELNKPIAILQDLQGPKIRVLTFEKGKISLKEGAEFTLTVREIIGNDREVSVSYDLLHKDVKAGDTVLLDDGNIRLKVENVKGKDVSCRVVFGGDLLDHKGLNLPGSILSVDSLTEKDKVDLEFGLSLEVDFVAISFVQQPKDVEIIKEIISKKGKNTPVIVKIEKPQAVENIEAIIALSGSIMIARGDLGVEMETEQIPPIQKKIIALCNKAGVPVITATQMLESMIHHARPTRAEASDVANAVLDGSDIVMLSAESASGAFPVETVKTMDRIVTLTEESSDERWDLKRRRPDIFYPSSLAIGYSACHAADLVNAGAIVCLTQSGSTAAMISRFRPNAPIIAVTPNQTPYNRTSLLWGVEGILMEKEFSDNMDVAVNEIIGMLLKLGKIAKGDTLVFTAGIPFYKKLGTNMLRIETA